MNHFLEYYETEKENLEKKISEYNQILLKEEDTTLKENLEVFTNLNSSGKRIRGILVKSTSFTSSTNVWEESTSILWL